jgi:hypothetical protein
MIVLIDQPIWPQSHYRSNSDDGRTLFPPLVLTCRSTRPRTLAKPAAPGSPGEASSYPPAGPEADLSVAVDS